MSEVDSVLVVDDDEILLDMMSSHLRKRGYAVTTAGDGPQAVQAFSDHGPFAVMVTDLVMPGMGGLELMREGLKLDVRLEVIVVTATGGLDTAIAAMREAGAYDYLLKPLESINELSVAVGRAAAHRRLRLEQEALQLQLRNEAELLQAVIAHAGDAILSADGQGLVRIANPAAARLLKSGQLVGARAEASLPAPLVAVLTNWQAVGGGRPAVVEVNWPAEATHLVSLTPLAAASGGWVMTLRDITHLKRLDDLRWQMLTEAASKIRMPLAQALLSLSELSSLLGPQAGPASDIVYRLVRLWTRIQDWLEEMLALVRVESGSGVRLTAVDVTPAMNATADDLRRGLLRDLGLTLKVTVPDTLPPVLADPGMLRQVLTALVRRAAQRSGKGGLIRLSASHHADQVWLEISDAGPPLPENELPNIFDRGAAGPAGESLSLNLALAKAIVDRMRGQVWVRDEAPLGGVLAVCLPTVGATSVQESLQRVAP